MRVGNHRATKLITKIDVTSLASIMVVLVFALMLIDWTNTRRHHGTWLDLPKVASPVAMPEALRDDAVTITVRRDGQIYVGYERFTIDQLPSELRQRFRGGAEQKAYIQAEARVPYKWVKGVLDAVRAAGVEKVGFLVERGRV